MDMHKQDERFQEILDAISEGREDSGVGEELAADGKLLLDVLHTLATMEKMGAATENELEAVPELDAPQCSAPRLPLEVLQGAANGLNPAPLPEESDVPELEEPRQFTPDELARILAQIMAAEPPEL